jgi:flavonoid 3'-monooxygenase
MISAGIDTSTVTVEWAMAELIRNPHIQRKLTLELDTVVGKDRMAQEADIPNLKYLKAVIKEVLRLHPPTPLLLPHESIQDCEITGYHVPAGTRLFVNVHAIGRSSQAWENPLEFDPERFIARPEIDVRGQNFNLLPFGSGRRACPAMSLGMVSLEWTIATLVHAFEWSLPAGESVKDLDMTEAFGITTPRANVLFLHAIPRLCTDLYSP